MLSVASPNNFCLMKKNYFSFLSDCQRILTKGAKEIGLRPPLCGRKDLTSHHVV